MGFVAPRHLRSSRTRARTHVPCIGRRILKHCATREALSLNFRTKYGLELASEYEMQLEFSLRDPFLPVIWVFTEWSCNLSAKVLGSLILQERQDNKSGFAGATGVYGWWGVSHRRGATGGALGNEGVLWTERGAVAALYYQIWGKRNMLKKDFKEILLHVLWEQVFWDPSKAFTKVLCYASRSLQLDLCLISWVKRQTHTSREPRHFGLQINKGACLDYFTLLCFWQDLGVGTKLYQCHRLLVEASVQGL